jgi:hypothetical protein
MTPYISAEWFLGIRTNLRWPSSSIFFRHITVLKKYADCETHTLRTKHINILSNTWHCQIKKKLKPWAHKDISRLWVAFKKLINNPVNWRKINYFCTGRRASCGHCVNLRWTWPTASGLALKKLLVINELSGCSIHRLNNATATMTVCKHHVISTRTVGFHLKSSLGRDDRSVSCSGCHIPMVRYSYMALDRLRSSYGPNNA